MTAPWKIVPVLCALVVPSAVAAQVTLGARAAATFPLGDAEGGLALKDVAARAFPLEAFAGWRLLPEVEVGVQGGWGWASTGSGADARCTATGTACSAHLWRLAARGEYGVRLPDYRPWVAATLGAEWLVARWEESADNWESRLRAGWLAGIEAGADLPVAKRFDAGVFAGLSFGQFRATSVEGKVGGYHYADSGPIRSASVHGWLSVGLRGRFEL